MNTNFKLMSVAMVLVGTVVSGHAGSLAASPVVHESGAAQIIRVAGAQFVPEAALYLDAPAALENGATQIIRIAGVQSVPEASLYLDASMTSDTGIPRAVIATALNGTESGASQITRVAGVQGIPEASLYWNESFTQESGASQIARVSGAPVPEAALYLGWQVPHADPAVQFAQANLRKQG